MRSLIYFLETSTVYFYSDLEFYRCLISLESVYLQNNCVHFHT